MKKITLFVFLLSATATAILCQSPVKAIIHLKDGKTVEVHHFGKLKCESNSYASTFTILKGKYNGIHTEISDYKDISKLVLYRFHSITGSFSG